MTDLNSIPDLIHDFLLTFGSLADWLHGYVFFYPLFMTYLWMIGAIYYFLHWDQWSQVVSPPEVPVWPFVSIIVPCHNEGLNACEVIEWLDNQNYPDYEIIAVNDGSTDDTGEILDQLLTKHERLRVIHFAENQGKAMGLRMGAMAARGEYLVCIDGDSLLGPNATKWLVHPLVTSPRVAAVTGNPRIRNRTTLLARLQVGEFSTVIGMIKRAQRIYGRIFTVSGVVAAFRKRALHEVGYWSTDMITEDIDISWKLQTNFWDVRYEPNALCWILMPETFRGLWRQRLRWAQGGNEVLIKYWRELLNWKRRRMWPVFFEYFCSVTWAYSMTLVLCLYLVGLFVELPLQWRVETLLPGFTGLLLGMTCLLQITLGAMLDSRYEKGMFKNLYWMIWYPLGFWLINMFTAIAGLFKAIFRKRGKRAIWKSPDRGVGA
ncbi:poly-beta-1,6-N-acetyl-D-glucosamine synthase [Deltaproteobacteria bacterium]|nr:poly-beta-1,6-N-acetyl-D-glucosamine synthase [Deltaproteobacteria bacterium]